MASQANPSTPAAEAGSPANAPASPFASPPADVVVEAVSCGGEDIGGKVLTSPRKTMTTRHMVTAILSLTGPVLLHRSIKVFLRTGEDIRS